MRLFLAAGAISGALAVLLGAFGAHMLKQIISPDMLEVYKTGIQYQFYHTYALLGVGILMHLKPTMSLKWSGYLFISGTIIFSGFLYLLAITGIKALGMIVPIGGLTLVAAWICLLIHVLKIRP
ncbi:MAG: DUF423 domain-containing protein [Prolixibacteraceae bacterium]|jgi:uncharacterized membrane protein YgdD (TMEM256/DUF423 family)|nr:DUF423 domain-containing protein [Prolixibacteraceae bacterium]